jgi:cysteinyl-tRNA synthetase
MDDAYEKNNEKGYISFSASHRELNIIPSYPVSIYNENSNVITNLSEIRNFLYLINPEKFATKQAFIDTITATNYDLVIMDLFFHNGDAFTATQVNQLRNKANGGKRLVICYLSIGEAEDYRYYWQAEWSGNPPEWIDAENPDWEGNYKVKYWNNDWQAIIFGNENAYLDKIIAAGFDGAYLDIIDAFEYFE